MIELKSDQELFYALPGSPEADRLDFGNSFFIKYINEFAKKCKFTQNVNYRVAKDGENQSELIQLEMNIERTTLFEHMERWIDTYLEQKCPICKFMSPKRAFFSSQANEIARKYALDYPGEAELKASENGNEIVEFNFDYFKELDRNASLMSSYFIDIDNAYKQANPPVQSYKNSRSGVQTSGFTALLFAALAFACFWLNKHVGGLLEILPTIGTFIFGLLAVFFLMVFFYSFSYHRDDLKKASKRAEQQADLDAAYYKVAEENIPKIHRYIRFCQLWCEAAKRPYPNKLKDLQSRLDAAIKKYNDRKAAETR